MPYLKTWHNFKDFYSVDMMFAYVNSHKHPVMKIPIAEFLPQLNEVVWGDGGVESGKGWSPMTVINNMNTKKYSEDAKRLREADLSYPVVVTSKHTIIDGYHRIAKAYLEGKKEIHAYVMDPTLMRKFLLVKGMNFMKLNSLTVFDILELWTKRFCNVHR